MNTTSADAGPSMNRLDYFKARLDAAMSPVEILKVSILAQCKIPGRRYPPGRDIRRRRCFGALLPGYMA
jgi:hypothetical protein